MTLVDVGAELLPPAHRRCPRADGVPPADETSGCDPSHRAPTVRIRRAGWLRRSRLPASPRSAMHALFEHLGERGCDQEHLHELALL